MPGRTQVGRACRIGYQRANRGPENEHRIHAGIFAAVHVALELIAGHPVLEATMCPIHAECHRGVDASCHQRVRPYAIQCWRDPPQLSSAGPCQPSTCDAQEFPLNRMKRRDGCKQRVLCVRNALCHVAAAACGQAAAMWSKVGF